MENWICLIQNRFERKSRIKKEIFFMKNFYWIFFLNKQADRENRLRRNGGRTALEVLEVCPTITRISSIYYSSPLVIRNGRGGGGSHDLSNGRSIQLQPLIERLPFKSNPLLLRPETDDISVTLGRLSDHLSLPLFFATTL